MGAINPGPTACRHGGFGQDTPQFGIDPAWIGVVGIGVGGKLAALCCHQEPSRKYKPADEHDRASCRPDFAVLVSPSGMASEAGKVPEALAGAHRNRTPPIFIAFAVDGAGMVPALHYLLALRGARVPAAFHAYEPSSAKDWPPACERWLKDLDPAAHPKG